MDSGQDVQTRRELDSAAAAVGLETVFQPVVWLSDGTVVGFEALARWPTLGDPNPQAVFAHAAETGRLDRLDQMCIESALVTALDHGLVPGTLLMLNCEPVTPPVVLRQSSILARAQDELHVMFELTERSLLDNPHALLQKVAALRAEGFAIALDDVGAHPDSLALLDIICPDVIKLDLDLVQSEMGEHQTRVVAAVLAHQERTGSVLLAEGIESSEHLEHVQALGATLGQGYRFGRPEPLNGQTAVTWSAPPMKQPAQSTHASPFDIVAEQVAVRTARKATLTSFSRHLETQARHATDPPMLLTSLQRAERFTGPTRECYRDIAETSPLVAIFGRGLAADLAPGIRGVDIDPTDPLCAQWVVLILGPHHAAALVAREHDADEQVADANRRFDLTITYDRVLVTLVARNLLDRIHRRATAV